MKRYIAKRKYKNKFLTHFQPQYVGTQRAFSKSNSGMVFEAAQLMDINSSPVLALFYADASFSGQHMTHHPIYSKQCIMLLFWLKLIICDYFYYFNYFNAFFFFLQLQFQPRDIQYTSLRTMANRIQKAMLPECEIFIISLHEGTFDTFLPQSYLFSVIL